MFKYFVLFFVGICIQITYAHVEDTIKNLNIAGVNDLAGNLTSKLPTEGEVEEAFVKKCEKLGGPEASKRITAAKQEAIECVQSLVDFNQLQEEMELAKPTGNLDSVFKKYCKKTPEFKGCVSNFTTAFEPCLEEDEKQSMATVLNVTEKLSEFICFKEGDRIALFIAEGGPECLNSSKDAIWECVEVVFKKHFPNTENITINDLPLLLFKAEQCNDFYKLQTCVVKKLEKCKEQTPANIIDSLFTFVRKVTPCASFKYVEETSETAPRGKASSSSVTLSLLAILSSYTILRLYL